MENEKKKNNIKNGIENEVNPLCTFVKRLRSISIRVEEENLKNGYFLMCSQKKTLKCKSDTFVLGSCFQFSWLSCFRFCPFSFSQSRHFNDKLGHLIVTNWKNNVDMWNIRARKWFKNRSIIIIIIFFGTFQIKTNYYFFLFLFCVGIYRSRRAIITPDAYNNWHTKRWKWTRCFGRGKTR